MLKVEAEGLRVVRVQRVVPDRAVLPRLRAGRCAAARADRELDKGVGAADEGEVVHRPIESREVLCADEQHLHDPCSAALQACKVLVLEIIIILGIR